MNDYARHKRPYQYNSKLVKNGMVDRVKALKNDGKSFTEIAVICGISRQHAFQIYNKAVAIHG